MHMGRRVSQRQRVQPEKCSRARERMRKQGKCERSTHYRFDPASAIQGVSSDRAGGAREGQRKESRGAHKLEDWYVSTSVLRVSDAEEDDAADCEKDLEHPQAAGDHSRRAASGIADGTAFAVSTITALLLTGRFVALTVRH